MSTRTEFYEDVATYPEMVERHRVFLEEYRRRRDRLGRPVDVLDVGCGEFAVQHQGVRPPDRYYGTDVKETISVPLEHYAPVDLENDALADAFAGMRFDVVFCGEVIEHVFSPDRLLDQLSSVMHRDSLLVLSTPNLAYWLNRLLLLAGINPLFVENSSEVMLGRRLKALGQGNPTQGHVRLFTTRAAQDLFARKGFALDGIRSVPVWNLPGDRLICRFAPKLAPDNVFLLRKPNLPPRD